MHSLTFPIPQWDTESSNAESKKTQTHTHRQNHGIVSLGSRQWRRRTDERRKKKKTKITADRLLIKITILCVFCVYVWCDMWYMQPRAWVCCCIEPHFVAYLILFEIHSFWKRKQEKITHISIQLLKMFSCTICGCCDFYYILIHTHMYIVLLTAIDCLFLSALATSNKFQNLTNKTKSVSNMMEG